MGASFISTKKELLAVPPFEEAADIPLLTDLWFCSIAKHHDSGYNRFVIVGRNRETGFLRKLSDYSDVLKISNVGLDSVRIDSTQPGLFHVFLLDDDRKIKVLYSVSDFAFEVVKDSEDKTAQEPFSS